MASNHGFNSKELDELERLVEQNRDTFQEAWDEHFA